MIKNIEGCLSVATESQILEIPLFLHKPSPALQECNLSGSNSPTNLSETTTSPKNSDLYPKGKKSECECPHVLIADDDPFQKFYYQTLFHRSISFDDINIEKEDFTLEVYECGEDLLKSYDLLSKCPCHKGCLFVILDFNMGETKMNGLETALKLRERGYEKKIVLRTSDSEEVLRKKFENWDEIIKKETITCVLEKSNHSETKEVIHDLLKKALTDG